MMSPAGRARKNRVECVFVRGEERVDAGVAGGRRVDERGDGVLGHVLLHFELGDVASAPLPRDVVRVSAVDGFAVGAEPIAELEQPPSIENFLDHEPRPLSHKATSGFWKRLEASNVRYPAAFARALKAHIRHSRP